MAIAYQTEHELHFAQRQSLQTEQGNYPSQPQIQALRNINDNLFELNHSAKEKLPLSDKILQIFLGFLLPCQFIGGTFHAIATQLGKSSPMDHWFGFGYALFAGSIIYLIFSLSGFIRKFGFAAMSRKRLSRLYQKEYAFYEGHIYQQFQDLHYRFSLMESLDVLIEQQMLSASLKEEMVDIFVDNDAKRFIQKMLHIENLLQIQKNRFLDSKQKKEAKKARDKARALFKESYRQFKSYKNPPIEVPVDDELVRELEEAFADVFQSHEKGLTQNIKHLL